ncbi:hypothetical protein H4582DRAFT_1849158 [Lactarius indigo]|nr:hypothetical protein H4582DRAFT_1849158 [Lactarius indigo]
MPSNKGKSKLPSFASLFSKTKSEPAGEEMEGVVPKKRKVPQSLGSSRMSRGNLIDLAITPTCLMDLRPNSKGRIAETTSLGADQLWSSDTLYRHLHLLESIVPRVTEADSRARINAFFFRVSAMLPQDQHLVLNMEQAIPATPVGPSSSLALSGVADYTAILADRRAVFLKSSLFPEFSAAAIKIRLASSFFVIEAKASSLPVRLEAHTYQAVGEIFACGKLLQKKVIRGALTNGHNWIFIIVKLSDDYNEASYQCSVVKVWF